MSRQLFTSSQGVTYTWEDTDDGYLIHGHQDAQPILDRNRAMAAENDGYTPSRDMRRVGSIPMHLIFQWLQEEGWNAFDPECADKLAQKLNDPDYAWLRTAPGRVAVTNGVMR